ncbi:MAG: hypothetical protein AAFW75_12050 [Cyanobacteria bacterium J06636_16]
MELSSQSQLQGVEVENVFGYPLTIFEQTSDKSDYIQSFTADYIRRHELFVDVNRYTTLVWNFMRLCTPSEVTFEGLDAVCMFTSLSFFIDNQLANDNHTYLERSQTLINDFRLPETPSEQALFELLQHAETLSQLNQISSTPFCQHLLNYIAAQQWKREGHAYLTVEDYQQYRPYAIALLPHLALLKLTENIDELQFSPLQKARLLFMEQLATRIVYLDNDLYAWQSDQNEPIALNLIKVFQENLALSWEESFQEVYALRNTTVERYLQNREEALGEENTFELRRYIELIECAVTGNFEAMKQLKLHKSRYERMIACPLAGMPMATQQSVSGGQSEMLGEFRDLAIADQATTAFIDSEWEYTLTPSRSPIFT